MGIGEGSCWHRARGASIRGKFVTYPEVKVQVLDLLRVVGIVAPFAPWGISIQGKFVLSRNPRFIAKRSSDPRVAYPEVKIQGTGPSASCWHFCPLCPAGGGGVGQYSGEIRFIEPQGLNWHRRPPGTPRESKAKFRDVTVWVL